MFVLLFPSDILRHFPLDLYTPYLYNTLCDRKHITKINQHAVAIFHCHEKGNALNGIL
jgi:hypothetical protein